MSKDGLCAIVTGSASGLGAATAAILAKGGARIVVNYSNSKAEAEATADLCRSAGAEVVVVQGDVSRDEDCRKIAAAAAAWGRLDVLVNNAGTTKHVPHHDLDGLSAEDFQRIYAVNTIGPFQMIRAARAQLEAGAKASGKPSAVVNVSSVAGISGGGSSVAYAASKGALNTMTQSLARALAPSDPRQHGVPRLYRYALVHQGPRRGGRESGARRRGGEGAAEGRLDGRRHRATGVLPGLAGVEQHDRRIRPHGRGDASGVVTIGDRHSGMVRSTRPQECNCTPGISRSSGAQSRTIVRCFASPRDDDYVVTCYPDPRSRGWPPAGSR